MSDNQLKVFISWSKEPSKQIAGCVRNLLLKIFPDQNIRFFLSTCDISAGEKFVDILDRYLESSCFGILILTKNNFAKEWLMYEAGALAKGTKEKETKPKLCPILFTRDKEKIESPLKSFHYTMFEKASFFDLMCSIKESIFKVESLNDDQKVQLRHSLDEEWSDFEQKVKQIIQEDPEYSTKQRITNDIIAQLLKDEDIYCEVLPRRDIHLEKLIKSLPRNKSERIIIFGGISTTLRMDSSVKALVKWKCDNPNSKLFICHESSNAASERVKRFKPNFYGNNADNNTEGQNRKVREFQIMRETIRDNLDEQFHDNLIFVEIDNPLTMYVTIQGKIMHLTPTIDDKRSSRTFTLKLKDSQHSEDVLDYLYEISEKSNNNEFLLKEIKLVSEKLKY